MPQRFILGKELSWKRSIFVNFSRQSNKSASFFYCAIFLKFLDTRQTYFVQFLAITRSTRSSPGLKFSEINKVGVFTLKVVERSSRRRVLKRLPSTFVHYRYRGPSTLDERRYSYPCLIRFNRPCRSARLRDAESPREMPIDRQRGNLISSLSRGTPTRLDTPTTEKERDENSSQLLKSRAFPRILFSRVRRCSLIPPSKMKLLEIKESDPNITHARRDTAAFSGLRGAADARSKEEPTLPPPPPRVIPT